jgi:hypothetical protein
LKSGFFPNAMVISSFNFVIECGLYERQGADCVSFWGP